MVEGKEQGWSHPDKETGDSEYILSTQRRRIGWRDKRLHSLAAPKEYRREILYQYMLTNVKRSSRHDEDSVVTVSVRTNIKY